MTRGWDRKVGRKITAHSPLEPLLLRPPLLPAAVPGLLVLPVVHDLRLVGAVARGLAEPGHPAVVHQRTGPAPHSSNAAGVTVAAAAATAATGRILLVRLDGHLEGGGDVVGLKFVNIGSNVPNEWSSLILTHSTVCTALLGVAGHFAEPAVM